MDPVTSSTTNRPLANRELIARAPRVVVKIGSSSLTRPDGSLNYEQFDQISEIIAKRAAQGRQVVLVTSGSIAAGLAPLGMSERPKDLATQQAVAAVGQGMLLALYSEQFALHGQQAAQVLLTSDDLVRRQSNVNAARALDTLLNLGVTPIVNENDVVATDEIRFGDNDRLAALVAHLVRADALVLLTDVDGLYDGPPSRPGTKRIDVVTGPEDLEGIEVTGRGSSVGTGGMVTKLEAASIATNAGVPVVLTAADNVAEALAGQPVGTWFAATGRRKSTRRLWLAHSARTRGRLVLDDGAMHAITHGKRSLLAAGITRVEGDFEPGDAVELAGEDGVVVARGLSSFGSAELGEIRGLSTNQLEERGIIHPRPAVHRDDLVITHPY